MWWQTLLGVLAGLLLVYLVLLTLLWRYARTHPVAVRAPDALRLLPDLLRLLGAGGLGRRPKAQALNTLRKVQIAQALYHDKNNSISDICRTLRISRATLYRYTKTGTGESA